MCVPSNENAFYKRKLAVFFVTACWGLVMVMPATVLLFGQNMNDRLLVLVPLLICGICARINGTFWNRPMLEVTPDFFRFYLLPPVPLSDIESALVGRSLSFFRTSEFLCLQVREDRNHRFSFLQKLFLLRSVRPSDSFIISVGLEQFRAEDREKIKSIFMNGPWPSQVLPTTV